MKLETNAFRKDKLELTEADLLTLKQEGSLDAGSLVISYRRAVRALPEVAREMFRVIMTSEWIPVGSRHWQTLKDFEDALNALPVEDE